MDTLQSKEEGTGIDIYNVLMTGQKVKMSFTSLDEARSFRNTLASIKHRQDKTALDVGLLTEEEIATFSTLIEQDEDNKYNVTFSFNPEDKRKKKRYTYTVVE